MKKHVLIVLFMILSCLAMGAAAYADTPGTDTVRSVQEALNAAGYDCGDADGIAGAKTSAAISSFQAANGLTADGEISDQLLESLGLAESVSSDENAAAGSAVSSAAEEPETQSDFYNLLIVGSDRRDESWNGNSDAIVLLTVNNRTKKVYLTSFMRDLGADIPGHGLNKINYSYAVGGVSLLKDTLADNFGVRIDNYIAVDWKAAAAVVDLFGGVDVEIKDNEIDSINAATDDVCNAIGADSSPYHISSGGLQHLSGVQAVGYSRIRFVGNNDYERTERQRKVLTGLISRMNLDSLGDVMKGLDGVLELVEHDLSLVDVMALAAQSSSILSYDIETMRVPFDGMYQSQNEMLVPEQPSTNNALLSELYA